MPDTPDGRERLARLEVQMANLTEELSEARRAITELTTVLHELRGGLKWAMAFGGFVTVCVAAAWSVATWLYEKLGGHP